MTSTTSGDALVSVVIPFFNPSEIFLAEAIQSVAAQTYSRWEIILVDDGSTDEPRVRAVSSLAAAAGDRVRLITYDRPGNRGISAARNEGLRHANGAYVSFLDADDVWLPGKLQSDVAALENNVKSGMVYSSYLFWYDWRDQSPGAPRNWVPGLGVPAGRAIAPPHFVRLFVRGLTAVPAPSCTTFRRRALEDVGGCEVSFPGMYEDQVLYAKVASRYPVIPLAELTTLYRQHELSMCAAAGNDVERNARAKFLSWLQRHMQGESIFDRDLQAALRSEQWALEHPRLARGRRLVDKLFSRLRSSSVTLRPHGRGIRVHG